MTENKLNNDIIKAFEPDYLNRKALATEWTDALLSTKINHHLVISVSGDWGTGKTYLAKNWHKYLEEQEYFTCYIDAHKKDYAEDPLLVFIEELNANINQYYKTNMGFWWKVRNKIPVLKNRVPKLLINSSTLIAGVEVSSVISAIRIIIQLAQKFLSSKIKDKLKYLTIYEKYISDFKEALAKFTCLFDKPVVIFIDELDRSNPKFVIKLIEQLKHIFEIPNLVFILTVNKKELSNTIKGIYGSEMDGYAYYKKFTTHDFTLYPIEQIDYYNIKIFIQETIKKYNDFKINDNDFYMFSIDIAQRLNLSLRDIEQILDYLYYIKEKVTQEYHHSYFIICFLYRAIYTKSYKLFIDNRIKFETMFDEDLILDVVSDEKNKREAIKIIDLFNFFKNRFERDFKTINIFSIIINGISRNIYDNINLFFPFKEKDLKVNQEIFHNHKDYIYYPILIYRYDESGKAIPCENLQEMSDKILSIRKNLIQLSMLGAVPKDNIRK